MTPNPTVPNDFKDVIASPTATLCGNFKNAILVLPRLLYELVNWMFSESGAVSDDFKRQVIPSGMIMGCAHATVPSGWLLCNGQEVSRTDYADLFSAIGVTYGAGNGTTTFLVPDYRARFMVGVGSFAGGENATLGTAAGADTVALTVAQAGLDHVHPVGRMHTNSGVSGDDVELIPSDTDFELDATPSRRVNGESSYNLGVLGDHTGKYVVTAPAKQNDGTDMEPAAHPNLPPYLPVNFMIKT